MTCSKHGGNDAGSVICRFCDLETIEREAPLERTAMTDLVKRLRECDPSLAPNEAKECLKEAADALESAGELPEPDKVYHYGKEEFDRVDKSYADTLRTAYSALAARLRDMQDTDDITMTAFKKLEDMNSELVAQRDAAIHGAGKLMQRAEQAELLNGLQAANITQLAAKLTQAESRIAEWQTRYNGVCDDLGASLKQHEDTKASLADLEQKVAVIYDGNAVYAEMSVHAHARTSPENVSDVLDSVNRIWKQLATDKGEG